jgi:FKBP-type peptidyl-prolyl cis-trans isomerase
MKKPTFLLPLMAVSTGAFTLPRTTIQRPSNVKLEAHQSNTKSAFSRRDALGQLITSGTIATLSASPSAQALVEGNPVPTKAKKSLGEEYRQGTAALADTEEAEVLPREAYNKLASGVIYADISQGNGETVKDGSRVNLQWVLRRSNGYFVDSSAVSDSVPFIFTVGDPKGAIAGLDEGIRGMKSGGTRRILIPPRLAYMSGVDDGLPGPIPAGFGPRQQMRRVMQVRKDVPGEYIFLEVKVSKVR